MSASRMTVWSQRPPRIPARRPRPVPTAPATRTAESPIRTEVLAPWMTRLRMSRPSWSVPRIASVPSAARVAGRVKRARRFCSFGSAGASQAGGGGARPDDEEDRRPDPRAARSEQDSRASPRAPRRGQRGAGDAGWEGAGVKLHAVAQAHARVERRVHEVDEDVQQQENGRHGEHHGLDQRHVLVDDRFHGQTADAGIGEHRLGDDRAAQEVAQLEPDRGHDRDRAVAEARAAGSPTTRRCPWPAPSGGSPGSGPRACSTA